MTVPKNVPKVAQNLNRLMKHPETMTIIPDKRPKIMITEREARLRNITLSKYLESFEIKGFKVYAELMHPIHGRTIRLLIPLN